MRRFKYKILQWIYKTRRLSRRNAKLEAKRLFATIAGFFFIYKKIL